MGITFYDKELLRLAVQSSGIAPENFEAYDEVPTNSLLYYLSIGNYGTGGVHYEMQIHQKVFLAQFNVIKNIASEGPCVIVGRCADYVLKDFDNVVRTFIYASTETRLKNIMERQNITEKQARNMMHKADKTRTAYYNYFTEKEWGKPESYDLMLDTTLISPESAADVIIAYSLARNSK